jgi:carbamoyl-phosphate synthase large subunit
MKGRRLCIAVSGIHLGENAQPGPGVVRSLRESLGNSVKLVGLAYDVWDSSLHTQDGNLDDAFLMPYPSVPPEEYFARLAEIDRECGIDVLIPCLDLELPVLQALKAELAKARIDCVLPERSALMRRSKQQLPELARAIDIRTPETQVLNDPSQLPQVAEDFGLPFVLKGPHYDAEIVHSVDAAIAAYHRINATWGGPLLVQRFVRGEEFNVAAVRDATSGVIASVTMRKTVITRLGKAWAGITVDDAKLTAFAERVISGLDWHGPCEVELLKDEKGTPYLIEVNPRFPAWIYLSAAADMNLPLLLAQVAIGRSLKPVGVAKAGVCYVRHAAELVSDVNSIAALVSTGRQSLPPPRPINAVA